MISSALDSVFDVSKGSCVESVHNKFVVFFHHLVVQVEELRFQLLVILHTEDSHLATYSALKDGCRNHYVEAL